MKRREVWDAVYPDWLARDLILQVFEKVIVKMRSEGVPLQRVRDELNRILDKVRQDLDHRLAVLEVKSMLEARGAKTYLMNCYDNCFDLLVDLPTRSLRIEVKPNPPPWRGLNYLELRRYQSTPHPVVYIWREGGRWLYCDLADIVEDDGAVKPRVKYPIEYLNPAETRKTIGTELTENIPVI